jgi:hypothetical protein
MLSINVEYLKWNYCLERSYDYSNIDESELDNICPVIHLGLTTRIGSESSNGQVFKYVSPYNKERIFALKIIPIFNNNLKLKIQNEIELGIKLSNYCKETGFNGYPLLFRYNLCNEITFDINSTLGKRILKTNQDNRIPGFYVINELLSFDLKQLLSNEELIPDLTEDRLFVIFLKVIAIIDNLNNVQKIYHNDLHLGNIMFRCHKDRDPDVILIDFGESSFKPKIRDDIWTFFMRMKEAMEKNGWSKQYKKLYKTINETFEIITDNLDKKQKVPHKIIMEEINTRYISQTLFN